MICFINKVSVYFTLFSSAFANVFFKILSNYTCGSNFLGGNNFVKWLNYFWSSPHSVFQYFNLKGPNKISMCLHNLEVFFSVLRNLLKLGRWKLVTGEISSGKKLNYLVSLLYSIFNDLKGLNSKSLIRF